MARFLLRAEAVASPRLLESDDRLVDSVPAALEEGSRGQV